MQKKKIIIYKNLSPRNLTSEIFEEGHTKQNNLSI